MLVDDCSGIIVPDSEGEQTLIFSPHDDKNIAAPAEGGSIPLDQVLESPVENMGYESGRRSLRKRKAIQRMPYSLDRIRHRQLLQGYDMSGFESISEGLKLPSPQKHATENIAESRRRDNDEIESAADSGDDDSDETVTSEEDLVRFRGRVVNMKTGFRGVLPRIAWKKALNQQRSSASVSKRRRKSPNHKGVAKKKNVIPERNANQDDLLLNDLVVPNDEEESKEDQFQLHERPDEKFLQELEIINERYQQRYDHQYLSDDEYSDEEVDNFVIELSQREAKDIRAPRQDNVALQDHMNKASDSDSDVIEIGAVEYNKGTIDAMLSKGVKTDRKQITSTRGTGKLKNRLDTITKSATSKFVYQKRSIRNFAKKTHENLQPINSSSYRKEFEDYDSAQRNVRSHRNQNKKVKNKKAKSAFGPFAPFGSENTRRANTFPLVIETPSDKYVLPKHSFSRNDIPDLSDHDTEGDPPKQKMSLSALDSLLAGKPVMSPDTVTVNLFDKQYTLSKFLRNDTTLILSRIFDQILEHGVSDQEILQISETLTLFLLHLNHMGVYEIISEFHKKFRCKVNVLRDRAKPIHFYQIAICQLMLLEVAKYSDISSVLMSEMKSNVINHVVSFFKLLSFCYISVSKSDSNYLFQSCDILSKLVHIMDMENKIWGKIIEHNFLPEVCFILVDTFPTDQPQWKILNISSDYISLTHAFRFAQYCNTKLHWPYTKELLFLFDKIFKRRRYQDFSEEDSPSSKNFVLGPYQELARTTSFNKFLALLRETQLTDLVVERITPIGELSVNDSPAALVNRLNLLIILARSCNINLEKRMENLIRPVLTAPYLLQQNEQSSKKIGQSILDGILSLVRVNTSKNLQFKGKILVATFKNLVFEHGNLFSNIWTNFLSHLIPIMEKSSKSKPPFLKEFYSCFILMSQKESFSKNLLQVLPLYLRNFPILGAEWVQRNIFQVIKGKVHLSTNWIDHYCAVGKYLIREDVLSWWSFYMYNDVVDSLTDKFYFHCKILQLCDSQSFDLIKRSMFETAVKYILENNSTWFHRFLTQLINRENPVVRDHVYGNSASDMLHVVKMVVWTLNRLSYNDLILRLISNLQKCYQEGLIRREIVSRLVEYLNLKFVDQIKDSHDFFLLKRELGISDIETEKSAFRDVFKSHQHPIAQACFIESGLIHACSMGEEIINYMEKLKSLLNFAALPNFFQFFIALIAAHLQSENEKISIFKMKIGSHLLLLINDVLRSRFLQVTPEEFLELCVLHKLLCSHDNQPHQITKERQFFRQENIQLQINVLHIAHGFSEYNFLAQRSKEFLTGAVRINEPLDGELSARIDDIARQHIDHDLHLEHFQLQTDQHALMSKLHDMITNISN